MSVGERLNKLLTSEFHAFFVYTLCAEIVEGQARTVTAKEFKDHAQEELGHAMRLIQRLQELRLPVTVSISDMAKLPHADTAMPTACKALLDLNKELELTAVGDYREAEAAAGDDVASKLMFTEILSDEQGHVHDLEQLQTELSSKAPTVKAAYIAGLLSKLATSEPSRLGAYTAAAVGPVTAGLPAAIYAGHKSDSTGRGIGAWLGVPFMQGVGMSPGLGVAASGLSQMRNHAVVDAAAHARGKARLVSGAILTALGYGVVGGETTYRLAKRKV